MVSPRYLDPSVKVNVLITMLTMESCSSIIPGIGFLYGGLARKHASLGLLWQSFLVSAVVSFQWLVIIRYSLAYSRAARKFIGNFDNIGLRNVAAAPSIGSGYRYIPEILFALFQCFFCVATVQIMISGAFECGRLLPSLLFGFIRATVVYCLIACWAWNTSGWLYHLLSLDYAGGGPVCVASGFSALAYALVLGKRRGYRRKEHRQTPHNVIMVFLGTCFIWFEWLCFNGGSTLNATIRAIYAMFNTNIAASCGLIGWVTTDYFRKKGKFSVVGACEGAIAGISNIPVKSEFFDSRKIKILSNLLTQHNLIGFLTAAVCSLCEDINIWIRIDEGMDVFKLHGTGAIPLGAIDGNGIQVAKLADTVAIASYSFTVSAAILMVMKYIPEEAELRDLDQHEFLGGETGDFWGVREGWTCRGWYHSEYWPHAY
ncbi:Rh-like protein/ammonium transporter [Choiromyces venosus 120613-1]|uniref:Rh-like protein/ammonium transporter n=1 Tax=Choiromyces venosus 120613-1 TaxID=1336337 RepID=A0A3N4JLP7_9PEZI|nr:Rh-like protein/ammonium transporter [Choiromyces venosus 120613-1]